MPRSINLHLLGWAGAAALLAVPLLAGAPWTPSDYAFAAVLLGAAGGAIELGGRISRNVSYRAGTLVAVAVAVLLLWVNAAVGIFGSEDNDANALFGIVLLVAVAGSLIARLRAAGIARAMRAAAATQLMVGITGWRAGWTSPGAAGLYEATISTTVFGALWLAAAASFDRAAGASAHSRTARPSI